MTQTEYKYQCNECYSDCNKNNEVGCFTNNEPKTLNKDNFYPSCVELEWGNTINFKRTGDCDVEKENKTTWHFEEKELKEVDHCQKYTCEDCAYDDGHLKPNVSCECGRNDDE